LSQLTRAFRNLPRCAALNVESCLSDEPFKALYGEYSIWHGDWVTSIKNTSVMSRMFALIMAAIERSGIQLRTLKWGAHPVTPLCGLPELGFRLPVIPDVFKYLHTCKLKLDARYSGDGTKKGAFIGFENMFKEAVQPKELALIIDCEEVSDFLSDGLPRRIFESLHLPKLREFALTGSSEHVKINFSVLIKLFRRHAITLKRVELHELVLDSCSAAKQIFLTLRDELSLTFFGQTWMYVDVARAWTRLPDKWVEEKGDSARSYLLTELIEHCEKELIELI
jgi:hypothetical protein